MRFFSLVFAALILAALPARADDAVSRGAYLAILGDCAGCHTGAHQPAYSGGMPFTASFGTLYSTNITPDRDTGIGGWTEPQFYRALHQGIAANGDHLYPAFPYPYFALLSKADTDDLFAYLKSLRPVHRTPTANQLIFPFNIRAVMLVWDFLFLNGHPFAPDPAKPAAVNRGAFLVNGLGHCAACHTPKNIMFGDETSRAYTGTVLDNWFAANLTGSHIEGLGKWSADDIVQYLATGRNPYATAVGSMEEKVTGSSSRMTGDDRAAIAAYLKTLAPVTMTQPPAPYKVQMQRGQGIFNAYCLSCHQPASAQTPGSLPDYPQLAGDTLVLGRDPTTVLRIILEGATTPVTTPGQRSFAMPPFSKRNDGQIADVATYIRNAWGNRASAVDATTVIKLRRSIAATPGD